MRSCSPTAIRWARASTWRRSTSTSESCTTPPTLPTRRHAPLARAGSATGGWTRRMRPLSPSRGGFCSARRPFCPGADEHPVLVRVVVLAGPVMDLATRVAALDLDRCVSDVETLAQPLLEIPHDARRAPRRALAHDHMAAERHLVRRQSPDVKVVAARHQLCFRDLL